MDRVLDIYYLGHSGFAAETKSSLLVFDYWEDKNRYLENVLKNNNKETFFFSSHDHHDHYDDSIERYKKTFDITGHFTGWDMHDKDHIFIGPHVTKEIKGGSVTASGSNDSGVSFLVRRDDIGIFHGGDLAGWEDETWDSFVSAAANLASSGIKIDVSFLAVTTFSGMMQKTMVKAAKYFIETLGPAFFIPMHANGKEYLYREFKDRYYPGDDRIICFDHPGDKIGLKL